MQVGTAGWSVQPLIGSLLFRGPARARQDTADGIGGVGRTVCDRDFGRDTQAREHVAAQPETAGPREESERELATREHV